MKRETSYEGKITLKVADDGKDVKTNVIIEFDHGEYMGDDAYLLIPALYDLLKEQHNRYSTLNMFRPRKRK